MARKNTRSISANASWMMRTGVRTPPSSPLRPLPLIKALLRSNRPVFQPLEPRKLLSATPDQIAAALDLPEGTVVTYSGQSDAVGVFENYTSHGLLGLPTGPNGQFLVLSTAHAYDAVRTTDSDSRDQTTHYRDLGDPGAADDFATVTFTLTVPTSGLPQRLVLNFIYASDKVTDGGDFFDIVINGVNIAETAGARIEAGGQYVHDPRNAPEDTDPVYGFQAGTQYSNLLSAVYDIPGGTTTLNIELTIQDSNSATDDAWALVDNVHFQTPQQVFLDFAGSDIGDFYMAGTDYVVPAFTANNFGLGGDYADVIQSDLENIFSAYNLVFTTTVPSEGDYMHVIIGGQNSDEVTIADNDANAWLTRKLGTDPEFGELFNYITNGRVNGSTSSYGLADRVDLGNVNRNDTAVIFSDQVYQDGFGYDQLLGTIAHFIGRNLGLRAEDSTATGSVMLNNINLRGMEFQNLDNLLPGDDGDMNYGFGWGDTAQFGHLQNANEVLLGVLGAPGGTDVAIRDSYLDRRSLNIAHWTIAPPTRGNLYDAAFIVIGDQYTRTVLTTADTWTAEQVLVTDYAGVDPRIVINAASRSGRAIDYETLGPKNLGQFNQANNDVHQSIISMYDYNGNNPNFRGTASLFRTEAGALTTYFTTYTFDDTDGDHITLRLSSHTGLFAVDQGPTGIFITLAETDTGRDTFTISVKKVRDGDGRVIIDGIQGSGLRTLTAKGADFDGSGVDLTALQTGRFGGVFDGTAFNVRQDENINGDFIFYGDITGDSHMVFGRYTKRFRISGDVMGGELTFQQAVTIDARGLFDATRLDLDDGTRAVLKVRDDADNGIWTVWTEDDSNESWKTISVRGGIHNVTISAAGRVSTIKSRDGLDADIDVIAVKYITVTGDISGHWKFEDDGTVFDASARKITVKGDASGLLLQAGNGVTTFTMRAALDSNLYFGFDFSVTTGLVTDASLLINPEARIKTLKISGDRDLPFDYQNTDICAASIGTIKLGDVNGDNDGTAFGVAAQTIDYISFNTGTGNVVHRREDSFLDNDNSDDFLIGMVV